MSIDNATPQEWDEASRAVYAKEKESMSDTKVEILTILKETLDERQEALRNLPETPNGAPNMELYFITRELGVITQLSQKIREVLK